MRVSIAKPLFHIVCAVAVTWATITVGVIAVLGHALYEGDID